VHTQSLQRISTTDTPEEFYTFHASPTSFNSKLINTNPFRINTLAASSATEEEIKKAKENRSVPVKPSRRIWRPQVTSQYKEPDCIPDPMSDLEILFKDFGKPLWALKSPLPPRDDVINFDPKIHQDEFDRNIQWRDCPENFKPIFEQLIKKHWDVFAEEGVRKNIRGVQFHVDTGEIEPVCTKPPRYGPHETRVINDLLEKLEKNGLIEDDDGPWGAPIVLAAKPNQEHVHWSQYVWRLCVSYRKINAVTRPFTVPIIRCDDAVKEIGNAKFYITMDLDSGYWQICCEDSSKPKLAFFTPTGKKRWTVMPMGATNAHPVFVALVSKFKKEWDEKASKRGLKHCLSQVIVDDIMLSARDPESLIQYFTCVLEVLQHYRCTAKLRKCRFLPPVAEFVGLDVHPQGNAPASSKFEAFKKLGQPKTFTDLNMLIGCFGFYQEHLPLFEIRIKRWRDTQKLRPPPGTPKETERKILKEAWTSEDDKLLEDLKSSILSAPILRRPDPNQRFYLKTDWSKTAMGAALLQPNFEDSKAAESVQKENKGEACEFDLTKSGLRLFPIAFISRRTTEPERSYHSYVGEACAGVWAIEKFRPYLFGREFTWLTDCSGLRKFFVGDDIPTHMIQRWRMQLLRYDFTIVHRPGRMMFECDLLSRYNMTTEEWRMAEAKETSVSPKTSSADTMLARAIIEAPPIPFSNSPIKFTKGKKVISNPRKSEKRWQTSPLTLDTDPTDEAGLRELCDTARKVWIVGARMNVVSESLKDLGIDTINEIPINEDPTWRSRYSGYSWEEAFHLAKMSEESPDWLIITSSSAEDANKPAIEQLIETLAWKGLKAAISFHELATSPHPRTTRNAWNRWTNSHLADLNWTAATFQYNNATVGGSLDGEFSVYVITNQQTIDTLRPMRRQPPLQTPDPTERAKPLKESLDKIEDLSEDFISYIDHQHIEVTTAESPPNKPQILSRVQLENKKWYPVYSIEHPGPYEFTKTNCLSTGQFLIQLEDSTRGQVIRAVRWSELLRMFGHDERSIERTWSEEWPVADAITEVRSQPPKETVSSIVASLHKAEYKNRFQEISNASLLPYQSEKLHALASLFNPKEGAKTTIDRWTTIPLPTHQKWAMATRDDPDLYMVCEAIRDGSPLDRHRLAKKQYHDAWDKGKLEFEEGILYYTDEPKAINIRQLRRRVVPPTLQDTVITAYHATPLAGHSGMYRTYWRIAARYWWPKMYLNVRDAVKSCAHCQLANAVGHESQQILSALSCDAPFDVIAIDAWSPGAARDKEGNVKALTSLCTMTGFVSVTLLSSMEAQEVARKAFAAFFVPNGLPKLVLIDAGTENKGALVDMCETLGIKYHVVSPENHNGILCERFHRYLNKVQKIMAANAQSATQWAQNIQFAAYSWNAAPIDGTNIIRSFVAKGRTFPFPLQISEENNPLRIPPGQGEAALAHLETNFPLLAKQSLLLQYLIEERREHHRNLANAGRSQKNFNTGDLVIIRKQTKSNMERQIIAKQQFKWKGIYRVLEKSGEKSYIVQRLPTMQGQGQPGRLEKYSSAVMEKIPSTLGIRQYLDTSDTRLAALPTPLVQNPLEQNLGFYQYGKYVQAPDKSAFAFEKVEDLLSFDLDPSSESEEDEPNQLNNNTKKSQAKSEQPGPLTTQQVPVRFRPTPEILRKFYEEIKSSKDKLFLIEVRDNESHQKIWQMVKVNWSETVQQQAISLGKYMVDWLIPKTQDGQTRHTTACRFWPRVHEKLPNGTPGKMQAMKPSKSAKLACKLYGWTPYQTTTYLFQDRLVGPFDFTTIQKEPCRISRDIWTQLRTMAEQRDIDISNLDRINSPE